MRRTLPPSNLDAHLGYWLRFVSNHVSHAFSRRLLAGGTTVAEWVMLREVFEHESVVPSVLADRLGMSRGAVSKLADRLREKGLIKRTPDARDRRSHRLALTTAGEELVPELAKLADENDEEFFGHLEEADRKTLERIMKEIVRRHELRAVPIA